MSVELPQSLSPGVSVVVTTFSRPRAAAALVAQLLGQEGVSGDWEILVVNDHGDPGVYAAVAGGANPRGVPVRFFDTGYDGFGAALARNVGLRFARHEAVVFLDDDVSIGAGFLAAYLRAPLLPRLGRVDFRVGVDGVVCEHPDRRGAWLEGPTRTLTDVGPVLGYTWGANFSVPTLLGLVLGGFDEAFLGEGEEDMDFGARAMLATRSVVVVPEARALHDGPDRVLAVALGIAKEGARPGRAQERFAARRGLVVNGGLAYWKDPRWASMVVPWPHAGAVGRSREALVG